MSSMSADSSDHLLSASKAKEQEPEVESRPIPASELPEPESVPGWDNLPHLAQPTEPKPKGIFTALVTKIKQIPACIYVVNLHNEPITVVVSKHRPNRLLSGVEIQASITGAGLNFTSATYTGPASRKTLAAAEEGAGSSRGEFPLFDRHEDFGVISIFKVDGDEKVLYIENDRVPMGATAYFVNKPDLEIVKFK
ncbi:hypothetical protein BDW75DRAFT_225668 [Aspergillus navahoensis]